METNFNSLASRIHKDCDGLRIKYKELSAEDSENINIRCDELMETRFAKYEIVAKAFNKYFTQDNLQMSLERKADLYMLAEMNAKKANKEEVSQTQSLIENLNQRVKHLSIVQYELARSLEPVKNSINDFD